MIEVGSNIRVTVGTRQAYGRVTAIYSRSAERQVFVPAHDAPDRYWDLAYTLADGRPGRWKQNVDGGYCELA